MIKTQFKNYWWLISLISLFSCKGNSHPILEIKGRSINFGMITPGKTYNYSVIFRNIGDQPLLINKVVGDCHCLNLRWPSKPILKNQTDTIFGSIDIALQDTGHFKKQIMIYANTDSLFHVIYIDGDLAVSQK